jgi:hypothetical protein
MLTGIRTLHSSPACRTLDVYCVLIVISNILFNVLDLDGSDLPRVFNPLQESTIVAVVPAEARLDFSPEKFGRRGDGLVFFADGSKYGPPRWAEISKFSPLGRARAHGYRIGLARNSLPDSFPYF